MDTRVDHQEPLLQDIESRTGTSQPQSQSPENHKPSKTKTQKAIRKTFKGTAHLAKLLPTGSVLIFQILSPVLTQQGQCPTAASRNLTHALVSVCAASCFLLSFTDSFRDSRGKVRYGIATTKGLWVIDGSVRLSPEEAERYRLSFLDFFHGLVSILVFAAVALFDQNVVKCIFPAPKEDTKELLTTLPVVVGVVCSVLFLSFPTRRHGVGTPLSRD